MYLKKLEFTITGKGPLMYGARIWEEKRPDETHQQFEERTWLKRCICDDKGNLAIKPAAIHRSLISAGKWMSMKLEGNKTYTKRFEAGMIFTQHLFLVSNGKKQLKPDDCERCPLDVPSNGNRGGQKRVLKFFPVLKPGWIVRPSFLITDEALSLDIIESHAKTAGIHDGLGSMRIANAGPNGMYVCSDFKLEEFEL